jgi:hypothetical protein
VITGLAYTLQLVAVDMVVELVVEEALTKLAVLVVVEDTGEYARLEVAARLGLLGICETRYQCNEYGGLEGLALRVEVPKQHFG